MVKQRKIMKNLSLHSDFKLVKKLLRLAYVTIMGKSNKNKNNCSHNRAYVFIYSYLSGCIGMLHLFLRIYDVPINVLI